jgi:hypothetical protein
MLDTGWVKTNKMTEDQLKANKHIPVDVIRKDITDTQKEIDDLTDINIILCRNMMENRVPLYFNSGKISKKEQFIEDLKQLLKYINHDKEI